MFNQINTGDAMRLSVQMGILAVESQMVITMRLWGMIGLWPVSHGEHQRMISEKADAVLAASKAVKKAMSKGTSPTTAALAAIKPLRQRTRANVKRLSSKAPARKA